MLFVFAVYDGKKKLSSHGMNVPVSGSCDTIDECTTNQMIDRSLFVSSMIYLPSFTECQCKRFNKAPIQVSETILTDKSGGKYGELPMNIY